eukprot:UN2801
MSSQLIESVRERSSLRLSSEHVWQVLLDHYSQSTVAWTCIHAACRVMLHVSAHRVGPAQVVTHRLTQRCTHHP